MELRHLRYFVAVAEELHFSRAAERLQMAQPPLSLQIRVLEQELGVQLLSRTKRHVQLTEAGEAFLQEARQTLAAAEQAITVARRVGRGESGRLVVGFVGSSAYDLLPALIRNFHERFPSVELLLREMTTAQQIRALQNRRIHIGVLRPPVNADAIQLEHILKEPLVVALPQMHPLAKQVQVPVEALAQEHFIVFPRRLGPGLYDQIISLCERAGFNLQVSQEAIQMQTILGLVAANLGIALIPASAQSLRKEGIAYRDLQPPSVQVEVALAWRREDTAPTLQTFLNVVRETRNKTARRATVSAHTTDGSL